MRTERDRVLRRNNPLREVARLASLLEALLASLFLLILMSPHFNSGGRAIRYSWLTFVGWLTLRLLVRQDVVRGIAVEARRRRTELAAYGAWVAVVALNMVFQRGYTGDLHLYTMLTVGMVLFLELAHTAAGPRQYQRVCFVFTLVIGLEVALSLPTLWHEPTIARQLMNPNPAPELVAFAAMRGVGQYALYTGLAILLPTTLAQGLASRGWRRTAMLASSLSFAAAIALATFLGAILLMVGGLLVFGGLWLFRAEIRVRDKLAVALLCLVGAVTWMIFVRDSEQMLFATEKFERVVRAVWSGSQQTPLEDTGRPDLFRMSWRTFVEQPVAGIGPVTNRENPELWTTVGGHSSWLDQLAEYGVVGFTPYLVFLALAARRATRGVGARRSDPLALGRFASIGTFIVGGSYNPVVVIVTMSPILFLLLGGSSKPHGSVWNVPRKKAPSRVRRVPSPATRPSG